MTSNRGEPEKETSAITPLIHINCANEIINKVLYL